MIGGKKVLGLGLLYPHAVKFILGRNHWILLDFIHGYSHIINFGEIELVQPKAPELPTWLYTVKILTITWI